MGFIWRLKWHLQMYEFHFIRKHHVKPTIYFTERYHKHTFPAQLGYLPKNKGVSAQNKSSLTEVHSMVCQKKKTRILCFF